MIKNAENPVWDGWSDRHGPSVSIGRLAVCYTTSGGVGLEWQRPYHYNAGPRDGAVCTDEWVFTVSAPDISGRRTFTQAFTALGWTVDEAAQEKAGR